MRNDQAVFAVIRNDQRDRSVAGNSMTIRLGQPTDIDTAWQRWDRLDQKRRAKGLKVVLDGKVREVAFLEMRTVDQFVRGLGRPDHFNALRMPLRRDRRAKGVL